MATDSKIQAIEGMQVRFCVACGRVISHATLVRGRWKAIFCSPECRVADKNAIRAARNEFRERRGLCPTCGHKRRNGREQMQANSNSGLIEGTL